MSQPRKYGVIKDKASAVAFINDLNQSVPDGAIGLLSEYLVASSLTTVMAALVSGGIVNEIVSGDAVDVLLGDLTITAGNAVTSDISKDSDCVIRLADRVYFVVKPYDAQAGIPVTQVFIKHVYEREGISYAEVAHLGHPNSNGVACALAYEITQTSGGDGDCMVKLAWCVPETEGSEKALGKIFSAMTINCYLAKIEENKCVIRTAGVSHNNYVFGAGGPCGGFVLHAMNDGSKSGSKFGLTIFNTDGSPLYTWCANSEPFSDVSNGSACNVNMYGLGRHFEEATENSQPIKVAVMAPIFCPSVNDTAKTAKWLQQSPHDYSYFDRSGHICMTKHKENDMVWLVDHGLCLYDGNADQYTTKGETVPDSNPSNLALVTRPIFPDTIPYADDFTGYFDAEGGVENGVWMSANSFDDMVLNGAELMVDPGNGKQFVRMYRDSSSWGYGYLPFAVDLNHTKEGLDIFDNTPEFNDWIWTEVLIAGKMKLEMANSSEYGPDLFGLYRNVNITTAEIGTQEQSPYFSTYTNGSASTISNGYWYLGGQSAWNTRYDRGAATVPASSPYTFTSSEVRFVSRMLLTRKSLRDAEGNVQFYISFEDGRTNSRTQNASLHVGTRISFNANLGLACTYFTEAWKGRKTYVSGSSSHNGGWGASDKVTLDLYFVGIGNGIHGNGVSGSTTIDRGNQQIAALKQRYFTSN